VCIVGKSWDYHVIEALKTTLDEGAAMIADSVEFLHGHGRQVLVDMEHFFDGYKAIRSSRSGRSRPLSSRGRRTSCSATPTAVRCRTRSRRSSGQVHAHVGGDVTIGIHCHDDTGCAVANSMAAVRAGARHVQGTLNGLGERTGNANLTSIIPNLQLKQDYVCLPEGRMERLTVVSHHVAELLNRAVDPQAPYVGSSAFAHKAGLHVSAIARAKDAYEHVDPGAVGNGTRFVVSRDGRQGDDPDEGRRARAGAGRAGGQPGDRRPQAARARGLPLRGRRRVARAADAGPTGWQQDFFRVESMRVITDELASGSFNTEATVKVWVPSESGEDERHVFTAEGNGPVNAIDTALRRAVCGRSRSSPGSTSPTTRCASSTGEKRPGP
jgi:2-isopropylmalate synthase